MKTSRDRTAFVYKIQPLLVSALIARLAFGDTHNAELGSASKSILRDLVILYDVVISIFASLSQFEQPTHTYEESE